MENHKNKVKNSGGDRNKVKNSAKVESPEIFFRHFTKSTQFFRLKRCRIKFWIQWYRSEILENTWFCVGVDWMPKFFKKCIFPRRLRKITWLFTYSERCPPTQNSILHLLSRIGHLPSDCTALRAVRYRKWSYQKIKGWYSSISSEENSQNRNSSIYSKMKKTEGFYFIHFKMWKGSIYSNKNSGIVLFDPVKKVEQFYYFLNDNWNSSISSNGFKSEQFYLFRSTSNETVLLDPRL